MWHSLTYLCLDEPFHCASLIPSTCDPSTGRGLKMSLNSRRVMIINTRIRMSCTMFLRSIRVFEDYIAALAHDLRSSTVHVRNLMKMFPCLRGGSMRRVPSNLVIIESIVSLRPPFDPLALIYRFVEKVLATSLARADTLENIRRIRSNR